MNGIQEVSGSIPLSSTKKIPNNSGFFIFKVIELRIFSLSVTIDEKYLQPYGGICEMILPVLRTSEYIF